MVSVIRWVFLSLCVISCVTQSNAEGGASASGGDHTSWRGTFLGQSKDDVKKALEGKLTAEEETSEGKPVIRARDASGKECGTLSIEDGTVVAMSLNTCFFGLDDSISDRDFAKIILDHYDIASFEPADPSDFQQMFGVSVVYKGNTSHGEAVSVFAVMGSPVVNVDPQPKGEF